MCVFQYEERVENGQKAFKTLSGVIKEEMARFERYRIEDFKSNVLKYIEALAGSQKKVYLHVVLHLFLCLLTVTKITHHLSSQFPIVRTVAMTL